MKKFVFYSALLLFALIVFPACSKRQQDSSMQNIPLSVGDLAKLTDSTLSNNEMNGKFLYTHLKYYLGTVDLTKSIPAERRDSILSSIEECTAKLKGRIPYDQIIDELVATRGMSNKVGVNLKEFQHSVLQFLINNPEADSKIVWDYCLKEEKKVRNNTDLTYNEKNDILFNHTILRYALKWKLEQLDFKRIQNGLLKVNSVKQINSGFWSSVACFFGTISGYVGYAVTFGLNKILGAVIGAAGQLVRSTFSCDGTNTNVCQDPLSVSFPYSCYTTGNPLVCTAVGYGNITPQQFTFDFRYNNDLNNHLYSNFAPNYTDNITLPGSYLTSNITDVAVQCVTSCSSGNPLWFGWFHLSDLGKPYFTISGNGNFTVANANYSNFQYNADGPFWDANPTIQWQIIPSGYPGYSATGTIIGTGNSGICIVKWDGHPGFATLQCTMTVSCATIVQYFSIHINNY